MSSKPGILRAAALAIRRPAIVAAATYVVIAAYMTIWQRDRIYVPDTQTPAPIAGFSAGSLTTADGLRIRFWRRPAREGKPTALYFHGNAGNLSLSAAPLRALADRGIGVLAIDYRGFGGSEGTPDEEGLHRDAEAAYAYARREMGVDPSRLFAYGYSLGTGVAVRLAAREEVAALVLEAPYATLVSVAQHSYPWLPVSWLMLDRFDSLSRIGEVEAPILILHGDADRVVPLREGQTLFAAAPEPKEMVVFAGADHQIDVTQAVATIVAFLARFGLIEE